MTKMSYKKILFIISIALVMSSREVRGDFDDTGMGARPIGMSNAFTAVADDIYALYYNPAGLVGQGLFYFDGDYAEKEVGIEVGRPQDKGSKRVGKEPPQVGCLLLAKEIEIHAACLSSVVFLAQFP